MSDDFEHSCDGCTLVYEVLFCPWSVDREIDFDLARRNYRSIIHAIHPDRNPDPLAAIAAKCVTAAWSIVRDNERYSSYVQYGTNDPCCCIDKSEFRMAIGYISRTLLMSPVGGSREPALTDVPCAPAVEEIILVDDDDDDHDSGCADRVRVDTSSSMVASDEDADPLSRFPANSPELNPVSHSSTQFDRDDQESLGCGTGRRGSIYETLGIKRVLDHRVRGVKLTIKVEWDDANVGITWEPLESLLSHHSQLAYYLKNLRDSRRKRWHPLVRKFPGLLGFVKN